MSKLDLSAARALCDAWRNGDTEASAIIDKVPQLIDEVERLRDQLRLAQEAAGELHGMFKAKCSQLAAALEAKDEACNRWEWYAQRFGQRPTVDEHDYPRLAECRKVGRPTGEE